LFHLSPIPFFQDSRVIFDQLSSHFHSYHFLDLLQMGFQLSKSTHTALIKLNDDIRLAWSKDGHPAHPFYFSLKPSTLFATISFCVNSLTFVCPILYSTSSSPISLADFRAFADRMAHPGHLFYQHSSKVSIWIIIIRGFHRWHEAFFTSLSSFALCWWSPDLQISIFLFVTLNWS